MQAVREPTFAITFDTELLWGIRFMGWLPADHAAALRTRDYVMPALVEMLDEYRIPATFAIVGHLLESPDRATYPAIPSSAAEAADWYKSIPRDVDRCPDGFLWPELPGLFAGTKTHHEIALHSFSHWHFESAATTEEIARFEIAANRDILTECWQSPSASLIFPRNHPGHLRALYETGVRAYRGLDPNWYGGLPSQLGKVGHVVDCVGSFAPPVATALSRDEGVLNIPGSYLLWSTEGFRRRVPQACRLRQMRKGLALAIRRNALFHLWMHPINMAHHPELMLPTLRDCLSAAASLRDEGRLRVVTMAQTTAEYSDGITVGYDR